MYFPTLSVENGTAASITGDGFVVNEVIGLAFAEMHEPIVLTWDSASKLEDYDVESVIK